MESVWHMDASRSTLLVSRLCRATVWHCLRHLSHVHCAQPAVGDQSQSGHRNAPYLFHLRSGRFQGTLHTLQETSTTRSIPNRSQNGRFPQNRRTT